MSLVMRTVAAPPSMRRYIPVVLTALRLAAVVVCVGLVGAHQKAIGLVLLWIMELGMYAAKHWSDRHVVVATRRVTS